MKNATTHNEASVRASLKKIGVFLVLTLAFSSIFWVLILFHIGKAANYDPFLMWSPGIAAILTLVYFRQNVRRLFRTLSKPRYLLAGYLLLYRPQELRWGATDAEVARAMPGDQIQPQPIFNATRAVTIDARPDQIWPWLAQIGYGRAGWYGYDWIDNDGLTSADRIIPALQDLKVGDDLAIGKGNIFKITAVEPNRSLVWASSDHTFSMALALYPLDASHTRLVWRIHGAYNWTSPSIAIPQLFSDLADVIAVRQNMLGIRARAEGVAPEAPAIMYTELALWLAAFLSFLVAESGLVVRRDWLRPGLSVAATGLITIGLVLIKPPVWVDGLTMIGVCAELWWTYRPVASRAQPGTGKQAHWETN